MNDDMTHLTLEQWGIVAGIIIAVIGVIGVVARMFQKMGLMSYQMSSMVKEWYTGEGDSKPLKEQIDDITHMVQIAERNTRPGNDDDNNGHDRIHHRIDELANDLHSSMRIVYKGQQQLQESINRLSERYSNDNQLGTRTPTDTSSDSTTLAS